MSRLFYLCLFETSNNNTNNNKTENLIPVQHIAERLNRWNESPPTEALHLFASQFEWKANLPLKWAFHFSDAAVFIFRMKRCVMRSAALAAQQQNEVLPGEKIEGCWDSTSYRHAHNVYTRKWGVHTVHSLKPRLHLRWDFSCIFLPHWDFSATQIMRFHPQTLRFFLNGIFRDFCSSLPTTVLFHKSPRGEVQEYTCFTFFSPKKTFCEQRVSTHAQGIAV